MRIKEISMAASALAMFGVVAPLAAQTVSAAGPSSALSGVAGVTDYSGSEIINNSASADANGKDGTASGLSHAGIGFESDDLILYQVPNFDFGKNNKIGVGTFDMLDSVQNNSSNRMAVIVDNRFTDPNAVGAKEYNWKLSAQAGDFVDTADSNKKLDTSVAKIVINDSNSKGKVAYNKPKDQNGPHSTGNIYAIDGTPGAFPAGLAMAGNSGNDIVISSSAPVVVASAANNTQPGASGLVFTNKDSVVLQTIAGGTNKLVPNHVYVAPITWTLTASPLQ